MTRKDYILIAKVIANSWHGSRDTQEDLVNNMAQALANDNPNFNSETFRKACGL